MSVASDCTNNFLKLNNDKDNNGFEHGRPTRHVSRSATGAVPLYITPPCLCNPCAVGQVLIRGVCWFLMYNLPLAGYHSKRCQPKLHRAINENGLIPARWIRPVPLMERCNFECHGLLWQPGGGIRLYTYRGQVKPAIRNSTERARVIRKVA